MTEELQDHIKKYNLGQLAGAELEQFEAEMLTDPKLAEAVREQRTAWEIGELLAEERLRAQIRERFAAPLPDPLPKSRFFRNWKFILPAMLLCIVGYLFFKNTQIAYQDPTKNSPTPEVLPEKTPSEPALETAITPKTEPVTKPQVPIAQSPKQPELRRLALANYRIPAGLSGIRGVDDDENLSLATKAFFEKNYTRTLELLKALPENNRQEALSIRAHAHFGAGNYSEAALDFSELEKGGIYRREAQWFVALARVAANPKDRTVILSNLDQIIQDKKHPYQVDAEKLRQAVRNASN